MSIRYLHLLRLRNWGPSALVQLLHAHFWDQGVWLRSTLSFSLSYLSRTYIERLLQASMKFDPTISMRLFFSYAAVPAQSFTNLLARMHAFSRNDSSIGSKELQRGNKLFTAR